MVQTLVFITLLVLRLASVESSCYTNSTVGSLCVASLVRDLLAVPGAPKNASRELRNQVEDAVQEFLGTCLGVHSEPLQPLNLLLMQQSEGRGASNLSELVLSQLGFESNLSFVNIFDLTATVVSNWNDPTSVKYDGFVIDPSAVVDLTDLDALAPLEEFVRQDPQIAWADVLPFFRQVATIYDGHLIAVPFTGQVSVLYYRKDVLDMLGMPVPATWEDLLKVAQMINGTDLNNDTVTDYAICWQMKDCLEAPVLLVQVAAPYLQSKGTAQGWMFDPKDMSLLLNSSAMLKAMKLLRDLQKLVPPDVGCNLVHMNFLMGSCAFTIKWSEQFKATEILATPMQGRVGVAQLPGSIEVLDRSTWKLENCTPASCPHATNETSIIAGGQKVLVNRAPHFGFGGFGGAARKGIDSGYLAGVYKFFANLAGPDLSWEFLLDPYNPVGPFRLSHVDVTDETNFKRWTDRGYHPGDTRAFLTAWTDSIRNPNVALDIRILNSFLYRRILSDAAAALLTDVPVESILTNLTSEFIKVLNNTAANITTIQAAYRTALGYSSVSLQHPVNEDTAPHAPPCCSSRRYLQIYPPVMAVSLVVFLALAGYWLRSRARGRGLLGMPLPPKPRPETTFIVATIPDLPALLRDLPDPVVTRALAQYLGLMRKLLRKYRGYEAVPAATPEDVFDMASDPSMSVAANATAAAGIRSAAAAAATAAASGRRGGDEEDANAAAAAASAALAAAPLTPEGALQLGSLAGDSWFMLCVFNTPRDAIRFATAAQHGLMHLDWPPALLRHRKCEPLYALPAQQAVALADLRTRAPLAGADVSGGKQSHVATQLRRGPRLLQEPRLKPPEAAKDRCDAEQQQRQQNEQHSERSCGFLPFQDSSGYFADEPSPSGDGDRTTPTPPSRAVSGSAFGSTIRVWASGAPLQRSMKPSRDASATAHALLHRNRVLQLFGARSITQSSLAASLRETSFREPADTTLTEGSRELLEGATGTTQQPFLCLDTGEENVPLEGPEDACALQTSRTSSMAAGSVDPFSIQGHQVLADVAGGAGAGAAATAAAAAIQSAGLATADGAVAGGAGGLGPIEEAASLKMSDVNAPAWSSMASGPHSRSYSQNLTSAHVRSERSLHTQACAAASRSAAPPPSSTGAVEPSGLCPLAAVTMADESVGSCLLHSKLSAGGTAAAMGSTAPSHSAVAPWLAELPDPLGSSAASFSAGSRTASFAQRYRALSRIALMYSTSAIGIAGLSGHEAGGMSVGGGGDGGGGGSVRSPVRPPSRCSVADSSPCTSAPRNNGALFRRDWHFWTQGRFSAGIMSGAAAARGVSGMSPVGRSMPCGGSLTSQVVTTTEIDVISSSSVRHPVPVPAAADSEPFSRGMPFLDVTAAAERLPVPALAGVSAAEGCLPPPPAITFNNSQGPPDEQIVDNQQIASCSLPEPPANVQFACPLYLPRRQQQLLQRDGSGSAAAAGGEGMGQVPVPPSWHPAVAATDAATAISQEHGSVSLQVVRLAQYYRAAYKVVNAHGQLMSYFKPSALRGGPSTRGGGGGGDGGSNGDAVAASCYTAATAPAALSRTSTGNPIQKWADRSKPALTATATSCMPRAPARPAAAAVAAAAEAVACPLKRTFSDPLAAAARAASDAEDKKAATTATPSIPVDFTTATPFTTATAATTLGGPAAAVARSSRSVSPASRALMEITSDAETGAEPMPCNTAPAASASTSPAASLIGKWRSIRQLRSCSATSASQGHDQQRQLQPTGPSLQQYQQHLQARRQSRLSLALGEESLKGCGTGSSNGCETPNAKPKPRVAETSSFLQVRKGRSSFSRESSGLFRSKSILEAEGRPMALFAGLAAFPPDASDEEPEPERALEESTEGVSTRYQRDLTGGGAHINESSRQLHASNPPSRRQLLRRSAAVAAAAVAAVAAAAAAPLVMSLTSLGATMMADDNYADNEMEILLADIGVLVQRGLRVCMGISSGIAPRHVSYNKVANRMQYGGPSLHVARAVSYAAHRTASRLLLSGMAYKQLGGWAPNRDSGRTCTVLNIGEFKLRRPYDLRRSLDLYMPLTPSQGPCLASHRRPRGAVQTQAGVMEAPLGDATVVFVKVVGVSIIMAWDVSEAKAALSLFQSVSTRQLAAFGGYLVELVDDLCLAAFTDPAAAIRWGLTVLSHLLSADWSPKLLEHELCEEVVFSERRQPSELATPPVSDDVRPQPQLATSPSIAPLSSNQCHHHYHHNHLHHLYRQHPHHHHHSQQGAPRSLPQALASPPSGAAGSGARAGRNAGSSGGGVIAATCNSNSGAPLRHSSMRGNFRVSSGNHYTRVLYRGLRLKIGIDIGPVKAEINAVTGRVSYRGKAMNRAARIAAKAPAGQLWCSSDAWRASGGSCLVPQTTGGAAQLPTPQLQTQNARLPPNPQLPQQPQPPLQPSPSLNAQQQRLLQQPQLSPAVPLGMASPGNKRPAGGPGGDGVVLVGTVGILPAREGGAEGSVGDDAGGTQMAVVARYQGRHQLKGVAEPMDLWSCRFEGSFYAWGRNSPSFHRRGSTGKRSVVGGGEGPNPMLGTLSVPVTAATAVAATAAAATAAAATAAAPTAAAVTAAITATAATRSATSPAAAAVPTTPDCSGGGGSFRPRLQHGLQLEGGSFRQLTKNCLDRQLLEMDCGKPVSVAISPVGGDGAGDGGNNGLGVGRVMPVIAAALGREARSPLPAIPQAEDLGAGPSSAAAIFVGGVIPSPFLSRSNGRPASHSQTPLLVSNPNFFSTHTHSASTPRAAASRLRHATLAAHAKTSGGDYMDEVGGGNGGGNGGGGDGDKIDLRSVSLTARCTHRIHGSLSPLPPRLSFLPARESLTNEDVVNTSLSTLALESALEPGKSQMGAIHAPSIRSRSVESWPSVPPSVADVAPATAGRIGGVPTSSNGIAVVSQLFGDHAGPSILTSGVRIEIRDDDEALRSSTGSGEGVQAADGYEGGLQRSRFWNEAAVLRNQEEEEDENQREFTSLSSRRSTPWLRAEEGPSDCTPSPTHSDTLALAISSSPVLGATASSSGGGGRKDTRDDGGSTNARNAGCVGFIAVADSRGPYGNGTLRHLAAAAASVPEIVHGNARGGGAAMSGATGGLPKDALLQASVDAETHKGDLRTGDVCAERAMLRTVPEPVSDVMLVSEARGPKTNVQSAAPPPNPAAPGAFTFVAVSGGGSTAVPGVVPLQPPMNMNADLEAGIHGNDQYGNAGVGTGGDGGGSGPPVTDVIMWTPDIARQLCSPLPKPRRREPS